MDVKEAERVAISKPVASRSTCSSFRSFSELLAGAIDASPSNVCSKTTVAAIRPKTVRFKPMVNRASAGMVSFQGEVSGADAHNPSEKVSNFDMKPTVVYKPLAKVVSKTTVSLLANMDEFISRFESPKLRERMFHFSSESIAKLKAKANAEYNTDKISSFQSLSALVWRCITRARHLPRDQVTSCRLATNNRSRIDPPLPQDYFGNCIHVVAGVTTAGELLQQSLGWAAWQLHQAVANHTDKVVLDWLHSWLQSPNVYQLARLFDRCSVMMGSSPRFNKYGNEFGMGKAVALCSGYANKFDGKVSSYPGYEGGGSVDLEVCLPPHPMSVLESDEEFMDAVFVSNKLH